MDKVNKHLKNFLPPPEIEKGIICRRFFVQVYLVTALGFLLAAAIIFLCIKFPAWLYLFPRSDVKILYWVILFLLLPISIFIVFHYRYRKNSLLWLRSFFSALCILLGIYTGFYFAIFQQPYIIIPFLIVAAMFGIMGIAAHLLKIDLSKKVPSFLTYILGICIAILTNYFFYRGFAWVCLSLLFVTLIGFFSINRERIMRILEIKNPAELNFDQRVMVGAFTISFAILKRMWTPKTMRKVHTKYRWFTDFEN
jgi:FtsH-binding integral membrane protein